MSVPTDGARVPLVQNGGSDWRVSLPPGASSPEALAARELVKYIRKISGAALETVEEPVASAKVIRIDCEDGELDGFDLTVEPDRVSIHGHTPRGALYGAYQVLEDVGCRWYYIGELGEVVPASKDLALPVGRSTQTASFRERSVMVAYPSYYERFGEWIDFLTKSRINNIVIYGRSLAWWKANRAEYLPVLKERRTILEFGGHILPSFVPRELFEEHADYFRMNEKGERIADHNFCPNSGAIEVLKDNVERFFAELPEITYFHVWADDLAGGGWCHCPKCNHLSPQDQNMLAMNAAAEVLARVNPKAALALLAYHDTAQVPAIPPASNLFLFHAPRERCYRHAFDDPGCRRNRDEYMGDWLALREAFRKTAPRTIHEFSYYTDGLLDREMQPPQIDVIPADARYFRSVGLPVHQNLMVCFRDWHSPPFSMVVFCRAAWNADINGWEVLDDFCRHYYGGDLAAEMESYYRRLEEACNLLFDADVIVGNYGDMAWPPLAPEMRRPKIADVTRARQIHAGLFDKLTAVLEKAPEGIVAERVRRERDVCELHDLLLDLAQCQFEGQFLGSQYVTGASGRDDGLRAVELLGRIPGIVAEINKWIERFPEEQKGLVGGWQNYFNSYTRVFSEQEKQVRDKLARED